MQLNASVLLISVVIPTCDRLELLEICLKQLCPGVQVGVTLLPSKCNIRSSPDPTANKGHAYEVVVSDDGLRSCKAFVEEKFPWVSWVAGPRRGPAANRNNGA